MLRRCLPPWPPRAGCWRGCSGRPRRDATGGGNGAAGGLGKEALLLLLVVPLVLLVQPVAWVLGRVVVPVLVGVGVRSCLPRPVSPPQWLQGLALVEHRLLELLIEHKLLALVVVELVVNVVL